MENMESIGLMEPMLPPEGERNLEDLAMEATKNISSTTRQTAPSIPWQKMTGLRDVLIHDNSVSKSITYIEVTWK